MRLLRDDRLAGGCFGPLGQPSSCTLPVTSSGTTQSLWPVITIDARGTSSRLVWLRGVGLNHRHQGYEPRALPAELPRQNGAPCPNRTDDLPLKGGCSTN